MKTILDILQKAGGWRRGLHLHIENHRTREPPKVLLKPPPNEQHNRAETAISL